MEYVQRIAALVQSGKTRQALALCVQYCSEQPRKAEAWFLRAGVQAQLGLLNEVVASCRKTVELSPNHLGAWYNLGVALQSLCAWSDAAEAYARAIRINPSYVPAYINITGVLRRLGRLDEALEYAREAVRLDPRQSNNLGLVLLDTGAVDAALEQFDEAIRLDHGASAPLLNKGVALDRRGDYEGALACLRELIQRDPGNLDARLELGNLQRRHGDFEAAFATYNAAQERNRSRPEPANLIALTLIEAGRPEEAIGWVNKALAIRSDYAEAYNMLAGARHAMGDTAGAMAAFEQALAADPHCAPAHNNLGLMLQQSGDAIAAEGHFRAALSSVPGCGDYENNLGTALMAQQRFDSAIQSFRSATVHDPRHAAAWNNLGNALLSVETYRENFAQADAAYRTAIELQPEFVEAHYHYGCCLQQQGRLEEALQHFEIAVELRPDYIDAAAAQVVVLEHLGRFEEANLILQPLLDTHKDNVLVALAFGVLSRNLNQCNEALSLLETHNPETLDKRGRIQCNFTLGDLCDDIGEYSRAFKHYHLANLEDHPGYDIKLTEHLFASLRGIYTRKDVEPLRASNRSELPVFIVGMPRSGTTLLEQILASHPDVHGAGELEDIHHLAGSLAKRLNSRWPYPACMADATTDLLDPIAEEYLGRLQSYAPGARRIVDKMPHNFEALGLIDRLFPGAHVLHCRRNPVDTCVSIYFKHFNSFHPYASDLASLGLYYREYERLMEYWKQTLDIPIMDVQYEDVVADQEAMSRKILEFVGLEWDERCLNYHQLARTVRTPSYDQVRKPIYTKSVERWRRYQEHLAPLLQALDIQP